MVDKLKGYIESVKENPKKAVPLVIVVLAVLFFANGFSSYRSSSDYDYEDDGEVDDEYTYTDSNSGSGDSSGGSTSSDSSLSSETESTLSNQALLDRQETLSNIYGSLPDGYIWDDTGEVLSMGDPSLSAEDTLFSYLNGLRTLDFSTSQRYSRDSRVINRYNGFFDSSSGGDYASSFYSSMYAEILKSIQVKEVKDVSTFVETRVIINVELNLLDLSDKDFWRADADTIFDNLYMYQTTETDSTRSSQYLYDYILSHFKNSQVGRRGVELSFILEKDSSLGTGWLVTSDIDLDNYCYYTDGTAISNYIRELYNSYGREEVKARLGIDN
jgi:hypothetical protein